MNANDHRARSTAAALLALAALLAACTSGDPRDDESTPTPSLTPQSTGGPAATPATTAVPSTVTSAAPVGSAHVILAVATANVVTIDVTDASATLTRASSGTPGDGASVDAYKLVVTNPTLTRLRLTWLGGPCDSANTLSIDAARRRLLLVQPECSGDAIATDRILDLEFATAVKAADFEAFLQDGLDTPA